MTPKEKEQIMKYIKGDICPACSVMAVQLMKKVKQQTAKEIFKEIDRLARV